MLYSIGVKDMKMHFKDPSNFNAKNGSKFSNLHTVRAKGTDPPPLTVSPTAP